MAVEPGADAAGAIMADLLDGSHGDDSAALVAAARPHVDDVVGVGHQVEVVLDDDDGRTGSN